MSSSPHRFNTAPARLGGRSSLKRASDGMTVWQLQEAMGTPNDVPVLATRVDSYRSNASSEHSDYGSWPRVRKQRDGIGSPGHREPGSDRCVRLGRGGGRPRISGRR